MWMCSQRMSILGECSLCLWVVDTCYVDSTGNVGVGVVVLGVVCVDECLVDFVVVFISVAKANLKFGCIVLFEFGYPPFDLVKEFDCLAP